MLWKFKSPYHWHYRLVVEDNFWSSAGLCLGKTETSVHTRVDSELKLKSLWINDCSLALLGHCVSALFDLLGASGRVPCLRRCLFVCSPSSSARGSSAAEWWWTPVSPHLYVCPASGEPVNSHRYIWIEWFQKTPPEQHFVQRVIYRVTSVGKELQQRIVI